MMKIVTLACVLDSSFDRHLDDNESCSSSSSLPVHGPPKAKAKAKEPPRRNVSFSKAVEVVMLEKQDPELYPELYYSASELRRFRRRDSNQKAKKRSSRSPPRSPNRRPRTANQAAQGEKLNGNEMDGSLSPNRNGRWCAGAVSPVRTYKMPTRQASTGDLSFFLMDSILSK